MQGALKFLVLPGRMDGECRGLDEGTGAGEEAVDATEFGAILLAATTGNPALVSTRTTVFSCLRKVEAPALKEIEFKVEEELLIGKILSNVIDGKTTTIELAGVTFLQS